MKKKKKQQDNIVEEEVQEEQKDLELTLLEDEIPEEEEEEKSSTKIYMLKKIGLAKEGDVFDIVRQEDDKLYFMLGGDEVYLSTAELGLLFRLQVG